MGSKLLNHLDSTISNWIESWFNYYLNPLWSIQIRFIHLICHPISNVTYLLPKGLISKFNFIFKNQSAIVLQIRLVNVESQRNLICLFSLSFRCLFVFWAQCFPLFTAKATHSNRGVLVLIFLLLTRGVEKKSG